LALTAPLTSFYMYLLFSLWKLVKGMEGIKREKFEQSEISPRSTNVQKISKKGNNFLFNILCRLSFHSNLIY
jgi:hypothetical protein